MTSTLGSAPARLETPSPHSRPVRLDLQLKKVTDPTFCHGCHLELPFGEHAVALATPTPGPWDWQHLRCYKLPPGCTTGDVHGLSALSNEAKDAVRRTLARARKARRSLDFVAGSPPLASAPPSPPKRKAARGVMGHRAAAAEVLQEAHPGDSRFVLTPMGPLREMMVLQKYGDMTMAGLSLILRANAQLLGGTLAEKQMRCVDGELRGALPLCPWCRRGRVKLKDRKYSCPGYFHLRSRTYVYCKFEGTYVERLPWAMPGGQVQRRPGVT